MKQKSALDSWDRTTDITPEEVRSLDTFKDWDEEKIVELINALKTLSKIMYNNFATEKKNGRIIAINIINKINIAA